MVFKIPNAPAAFVPDQAEPDSADFEALGNRSSGVVSGCSVTQNSVADSNVLVADGEVISNGVYRTITGTGGFTTLDLGPGDGVGPRFDLVVVDSSGTVTARTGTASSNIVFPALSAGDVLLAAVYRGTGTGDVITNDRIISKRIITPSNVVRSGSGTPSNSLGSTGDLYVNTAVSSNSGQSQLWVKTGASLWENLAEYTYPETSDATGNTLVRRDASGNFAAGTITATFSGNGSAVTNLTAGNLSGTIPSAVLGNSNVFLGTTAVALNRTSGAGQTLNGVNVSGSAGTAGSFTSSKTVTLTGDVTGTVSSDFSSTVSVATTIAATSVENSMIDYTSVPQITVSTTTPTSQGKNGDIWIVV